MNEFEFTKKQKQYLVVKRIFDIVISFFGIIFCSIFLWPWVLIINLFVCKGKPLFFPLRLGKNKKPFRMFKFRSMKNDAPIIPPYEMSKDEFESYETGFGRFLRKSSIDESLQFINVLIGQMSIVGPRPGAKEGEDILIKARESYSPSAYEIKPGITGYSQVYMKRQHDAMSKAWFDSEYVKKMSFILDLKIIIHTVLLVFKGR